MVNNQKGRLRVYFLLSCTDICVAVHRAYYIPFPKNQYFVGRRDELERLRKKLIVDQDCQKISIVGLGGTGKTQVALQFAHMVKETHPEFSIFWLPALSMASFEQACVDIARALHIPLAAGEEGAARELVKQHLSTRQAGRWLLVLDNADDTSILFGKGQSKGIIDYLPESEGCVTVYTTRTQEVAVSLTHSDVLELGAMSQPDAADFLEKSLIEKELLDDGATTRKLLDELAYLPLAIRQAAAYLNMNKMPITKYLRLLRSTEQEAVGLINKEFLDDTRYRGSANAVATTWVVSFNQLKTRDAAAADLLAFMSCIEWKAIPRAILPKVRPKHRMEEALGTLRGYSFLIQRENGDWQGREHGRRRTGKSGREEWFDMHRLVHLATRIWINHYDNAAERREGAVQHVTKVFPSHKYKNRALWRAFLPHALRLLESEQEYGVEESSKLCLRVGQCLQVDGRIPEAVRWLQESCRQRERLSADNSDRLLSQYVLAGAYEDNGQVKEAVELLESIVAIEVEVLAEDHPSRLASQRALAGAYQANGQVKEAVKLLESVVAIEAEVLAEDHPSRLASQHALAGAYKDNGQVKEAVELLESVVTIEAEVLAEDHPDRLASQHALAGAYEANGQVKEAVDLLENVVAIRSEVLAEDHPSRLASQHALARAYQANGQVKEAVELLESVVAIEAEVLVEDHPSRLASQHALAGAYKDNGQVKEAVELLESIVTIEAEVLAEDHPDRLASQHALAIVYKANGQVKEAVKLLESVVAIEAEVLAEDHPDRLASQHALAKAYKANRQVKEAVELLESVVAIEAKVLAEDHPDRLASQRALARAYKANGQPERAIELMEYVASAKARVFRADHPSRLSSMKVLRKMYARKTESSS